MRLGSASWRRGGRATAGPSWHAKSRQHEEAAEEEAEDEEEEEGEEEERQGARLLFLPGR